MEDGKLFEESWDKKKLAVGSVVVLLIGVAVLYKTHVLVLADNKLAFHSPFATSTGQVAGAETSAVVLPSPSVVSSFSPSSVNKTVQGKLDEIKKEITDLNASDLASSSPQVQKVLSDLKSLQKYPQTQAKDVCEKICGGL